MPGRRPDPPAPARGRLRIAAVAIVTLVALAGAAALASGGLTEISEPATSGARAQRLVQHAADGDLVVVYNIGELRSDVEAAVAGAAAQAGAAWAPSRSAMAGVVAVRRDGAFVQSAAPGFRYPLVVTAMPAPVVGAVFGGDLAAVLGADSLVMGERTAALRTAQVGDVLDVVAANGSVQPFRVGLVVGDDRVGGAEVIMSTDGADRLGIVRATRAVVWGFPSRTAIDGALAAHGVPAGLHETRVVRSWDPPRPDATLSTARVKELLGEFSYRVNSDGSLTQDSAWVDANLPPERELLNDTIRIRARCHHGVAEGLRAALADVAAAGLASAIEVGNTNTFGGCHSPRFNRISGELGFVSRHAWAMALDINTVSNCQGCVPKLDCDVVRIFRRHGFAWGGNFLRPDGMHFEWVGEPRDHLPYPVDYCPNEVPPTGAGQFAESLTTADSRDQLFADDTLTTGHDHVHDPDGAHGHEHG